MKKNNKIRFYAEPTEEERAKIPSLQGASGTIVAFFENLPLSQEELKSLFDSIKSNVFLLPASGKQIFSIEIARRVVIRINAYSKYGNRYCLKKEFDLSTPDFFSNEGNNRETMYKKCFLSTLEYLSKCEKYHEFLKCL